MLYSPNEDHDTEIAAEIAERKAQDSAEITAAWAPVLARRNRDPKENAADAMAGYMVEALNRIRAWCCWHSARASAEKRSLPNGETAFMRVADVVEALEEVTEARGIRPNLMWVAGAAFDAALEITHEERRGRYPDAHRHQIEEVSSSPIRALLWTIAFIADRHWQMSEGFLTVLEAQLAAADDALDAPFPPPPTEEDAP
jgi:hypothetical protein